MKYFVSRSLSAGACFLLALLCVKAASAQQVTYYDFDTPQATPGQASYTCQPTAPSTGALFCFNDRTGANSNPQFLSDTYPPNIDPLQTDNPPVSSTHSAVQMTPSSQQQAASMWFSVPQKVSNGFTSYFAFKFTPDPASYATADGIAFVIQNSQGGSRSDCTPIGAGLTIVGDYGGCIGYGGIDNSVAFELDTYKNPWDPADYNNGSSNDNHVAIQNCGAGLPNSADHTGSCLVNLSVNDALQAAINSQLSVTLADGNVHEVVINYSGPNEAVPYLLQVFIDPPFVPGTHTPLPEAVPVLSGVYNIGANLNLINSGSANDSAYVGFTSATGGAFEHHELMAWTFTPHTPVTQQQPLNPPGQATTFPFGSHVYAVTYPADGPSTSGIEMIVTANTVTPQFFTQLISGGPFAGSQCQIYDETGGNCVIYTVSCIDIASGTPTQCPVTDPSQFITVKAAYNASTPAVSPGYLQGDPLYSQVTSISGDGQTATVTCNGECSVTTGETITLAGSLTDSNPSAFNGTLVVLAADPMVPDTFTFSSTVLGTATGGYLTSNNIENIFTGYSTQRIDPTTTGRTHNFSGFVPTSLTAAPTGLTILAPPAAYGTTAPVTVTATSGNGTPTGSISLAVDGETPLTVPLTNGVAVFGLTGLTAGLHQLAATYPTNGAFLGGSTTGSITITAIGPTVTFTGAPASAAYHSTFAVIATSNSTSIPVITASGACSITGLTVTITAGSGTCGLLASWAADTNYNATSAAQTVTAVKAASTTNILSAAPNPATTLSPVLVTFSVTGNGAPTGAYSVKSSVSGDPSCSGTLAAGAGSCSLSFPTSGSRKLTVTYAGDGNFNGSSASVSESVANAPSVSLSATSINFGTFYLGDTDLESVTVTNTGKAALTINDPFLFDVGNGDSQEFVALNLCPRSLGAGKNCTIYILFAAGPKYGLQTAVLKIVDNASDSPQSVSLSATVINPRASLPNSVNFGTQRKGSSVSSVITLTNSGSTALTLSSFSLSGSNRSDFGQSNNCPASLAPNASCKITVSFKPSATGNRSATLNIVDNTRSGTEQVSLTGKGN